MLNSPVELGMEEPRTMSIAESLKGQLDQLTAQRREHEKAANAIRRNEVKVRKALSSVASLPPVNQS
jgi:hypothetical protein